MRLKILLLLLSLMGLSGLAEARFYRWVDETGKVHITDKLPPDQAGKEHETLNKTGRVVETTKAAKTPEDAAREAEIEKRRVEQQRLVEEQKKQDQVLLNTYRNEDEIIDTRDGKLKSVESRLHLLQRSIERNKQRLTEKLAEEAGFQQAGQAVPPNLKQQIASASAQLVADYQDQGRQEKIKQEIRAAFAADLARFRELKDIKTGPKEEVQATKTAGVQLDNLLPCQQGCEVLWYKIKGFVEQRGNTAVQLSGDDVIITRDPTRDEEIALSVSRTRKQGGTEEFFLDLKCKNTAAGQARCASPEAKELLKAFRGLQ